jgi:hypothetical protein
MMEVCSTYESSEGDPVVFLTEALDARWAERARAPGRFRATSVPPHLLQVDGSSRFRPPFGLIGQEIVLRHTVYIELMPPRSIASPQ